MTQLKKKHAGGRPSKITPSVLRKLEEAYLLDATHLEAAIYAGISESTLHDYRKKNPEFSERMKVVRRMTGLQAKINITKAIKDGDIKVSKWYLERRDDDFKPRLKVEKNTTHDAAVSFLHALAEGRRKEEQAVNSEVS